MRISVLLFYLSISITLQAQDPGIKRIKNFKLDGFAAEWNMVNSIILSNQPTKNSPGIEIGGSNRFNHQNDLSLKVKFGWNEEGLLAFVVWRDDLFHETYIPHESRRWSPPSGRPRDKLYYFDNMSIRIFGENNFYKECWIAPREKQPIQWYSGAISENSTSLTGLPQPNILAHRPDLRVIQMEILWSWELLGLDRSNLKELTLQVLVTDSDHPEKSLLEKEEFITYIYSQRQKMRFSN